MQTGWEKVNKILVFIEQKEEKIRNVSYESLTAATRIANGGQVIAVVFQNLSEEQVGELGKYGADQIAVILHESCKQYTPDAYTQALVQLINTVQPDTVIMGHTALGKDLAPRLAARIGAGLISDCTDIGANEDDPVFVRPIYSGKAFQKRKFSPGLRVVTIRPNNIEPECHPKIAQKVDFKVEIRELRAIVKEIICKATDAVDLSEAKIVIAGGRGVKSKEGFQPLRDLANLVGAGVGASRGACDADYCDYSLQIGQTGKIVTPDLYIACGISGAIQHLAGMSNSKVIVAINKDPDAPIFQIADYGIVGDLFEVVPLLTKELAEILQHSPVRG